MHYFIVLDNARAAIKVSWCRHCSTEIGRNLCHNDRSSIVCNACFNREMRCEGWLFRLKRASMISYSEVLSTFNFETLRNTELNTLDHWELNLGLWQPKIWNGSLWDTLKKHLQMSLSQNFICCMWWDVEQKLVTLLLFHRWIQKDIASNTIVPIYYATWSGIMRCLFEK